MLAPAFSANPSFPKSDPIGEHKSQPPGLICKIWVLMVPLSYEIPNIPWINPINQGESIFNDNLDMLRGEALASLGLQDQEMPLQALLSGTSLSGVPSAMGSNDKIWQSLSRFITVCPLLRTKLNPRQIHFGSIYIQ